MNKLYVFTCFLSVIIFAITASVDANWIKTGNSNPNISDKSFSQNSSKPNKSDTLPDGVTQDWLNDLRDENGVKINSEINTGTSREIPDDPEGDAFQRKIFNGPPSGGFFGFSVSSAGDVNGDGFDDVIIGAYAIETNKGKVFIYYGGLNMNTLADISITGINVGFKFGTSVSSAGDVNGDGYSDVIIGSPGFSSHTGKAYIYFGGIAMNTTIDVEMTGEAANNYFGNSVSSAGDVNGDGYSDVIVGAYGNTSYRGRAYIYFGGVSMNNAADVTLTGSTSNNFFGYSVSEAGDFNGDGYNDVVVGSYGNNSNTGAAFIFNGGSTMNNGPDVIFGGEAVGALFGKSVSSSGDVNGDGYSDIIAGSPGYGSNTGRAYVCFGGANPNNSTDITLFGETTGDKFGLSISTAGDINGDGYSDVIVGASGYSFSKGRVYIYFGGESMNNISDADITGENSSDNFGASVSKAGDINNDGYTDIIVGAYGVNSNDGRAYVYDYFMKGNITADYIMSGVSTFNGFGYSVSSAGDVNGDGYSDVIVGASRYSSNIGRAYIYYGGISMDNTADVTMSGLNLDDNFGISVSSAGDVNGDGYSDVIVGAYGYSSFRGRAYIFYGGSSMNNIADVTMTGETSYDIFGITVSTAGDVNGDGFSDVIIGANVYSSLRGKAYLFFGGSTMNNTADLTMIGDSINYNFGGSVSTAGDVNGDGYSDVIVGARGYSLSTGKAYIYFGGPSMNNSEDVTLTGEGVGSRFGISVSNAGDVNGDGYSDVIVGAIGNSSIIGKAFIYYGGTLMDITADVIMTGQISLSYFGNTVSDAGDINRDGYSDVIVGASGSASTGNAYVFLGGASMDNTADMGMISEASNSQFGISCASAGDINGDGYSDLIIGEDAYSSYTGRAFIYLGSAISVNPIFKFVKDVPDDQGGKVFLKWIRSSYDVNNVDRISSYSVIRSLPPVSGNFSWQEVANISAQKFSSYTYINDTPFDSSTNNSGNLFYRIKANTNNPSEYWYSGILSGRSIDNIPPPMVSPFTSALSGENVLVSWGFNTALDLLNFVLFKSTSPTLDPYTATPLATITSTTYLDTSPLNGLYYYFIVAQDIHGNYSPIASTTSPFFTIDLTMFIEGFYNAGSNTQISDTLKTYLRNTSSPYNIADNSTAVVSTIGKAALKFSNAPNGSYYLVINHRNSIETWSSAGITVTGGSAVNFNLTFLKTQAYGSNQIQIDAVPVRYGVYSGDVNQDGTIDLTDGSMIDNDAFNFESGYIPTDVNGDGLTDLADAVFADNNGFNFISKITP